MGNFLNNVIKSREEWLKTPRPIPKRAMQLNAEALEKPDKEALEKPDKEALEKTDKEVDAIICSPSK